MTACRENMAFFPPRLVHSRNGSDGGWAILTVGGANADCQE